MADVGEGMVSKGGVRSSNAPTPTLERKVNIQPDMSTPSFGSAFSQLAFTPDAMAEIGSQIATNANIKMAEILGEEMGKKPQGNLLPPITKFDEYVSKAYSTQAQVTLGLQANQMMQQAQTEMNQQYKLSPDMIGSYAKNMSEGIGQILANAPSNIRPQLEAQLGSQLISTTANYNNRLATQNKEDAKDSNDVWLKEANQQMDDLIKDGSPEAMEAAEILRNQINENIDNNESIGMLNKKQAYTAKTETKLNFESALSIEKYRNAVAARKGDEYLASIAFDKIPGLSWSESEAVRNNTMRWAQAALAADQRHQSLLMAEAQNDIANGQFSPKINYYEENMNPTNFLNTMTSWTSRQRKEGQDNVVEMRIVADPNNPDVYEGAKPQQINKSYHSIADGIYRNNQEAVQAGKANPISTDDAEVMAQRGMAVAAPAFSDKINQMAASANPEALERAYNMYDRLQDQGSKVLGVKDQNIANMKLYKELLGVYPNDPQKAAEMAYNATFKISPEEKQFRRDQLHEYTNRNANTIQQKTSWAMKMGNFKGMAFQDQSAYTAQVSKMFNDYLMASGNVNVAEEMTREAVGRTYGETEINGTKQVAFLPVENTLNLTGSSPIIQQNLADQLAIQCEESKKNFDENPGQLSYVRLKEGRISFDEYIAAKNKIREHKYFSGLARGESPRTRFAKEFDIIAKFESGQQVVVEEVHRGGEIVEYPVQFINSEIAFRDPNTGQVQGGMNAQIIDPLSKMPRALPGYFGQMRSTPYLKVDSKYVTERYIAMYHPGEPVLSPKEIIEQHKVMNAQSVINAQQLNANISGFAAPVAFRGGK